MGQSSTVAAVDEVMEAARSIIQQYDAIPLLFHQKCISLTEKFVQLCRRFTDSHLTVLDAGDDHLHALTVVLQHPRLVELLAALQEVLLVGAVAEGLGAGVVEGVEDLALVGVGTTVGIDLLLEYPYSCVVVAALVTQQLFVLLHLGHVVVLLLVELSLQFVEHAVQVVLAGTLAPLLGVGVQGMLEFIDVREILLLSFLVLLHELVPIGQRSLMLLNCILKQSYLIRDVLDHLFLDRQHPLQLAVLLLQLLHMRGQLALELAGTGLILLLLDVGVGFLALVFQVGRDVFRHWGFGGGFVVVERGAGSWWKLQWSIAILRRRLEVGLSDCLRLSKGCVVGGFGLGRLLWFRDADGGYGGDHEVVGSLLFLRNDSGVELLIGLDLQLLAIGTLHQSHSIPFPANKLSNFLVLHRDEGERLSPLLVVTDPQLSIGILPPHPPLSLLCYPETVVAAQLNFLELLRYFAKLSRNIIGGLQVLAPDIKSAILRNAQEVL